jgi:beta-mannosidase
LESYRDNVGRFMSEYGFQSFPHPSVLPLNGVDSTVFAVDHPELKRRQKSYIGNEEILKHLEKYYPNFESYHEFVYLSQLTQAKALEMAITSHRIAKGHCMGSLYWQLNDVWAGPSWSTLDVNLNWKAAHYRVRDCFAPLALLVTEKGRFVEAALVADGPQKFDGRVRIQVCNFNGDVIQSFGRSVKIRADTVHQIFNMIHEKIWDRRGPVTDAYLRVELLDLNGNVAQRKLYFGTEEKKLNLQNPNLKYDVHVMQDQVEITITATTSLAKHVWIDIQQSDCSYSDNFFDLEKGEERTIIVTKVFGPAFYESKEAVQSNLSVRSLYDLW